MISYLAGIIAADGHIKKKDLTISIYTKNGTTIKILTDILKRLTKNKISIRYHNNSYEISVTDKKLAKMLINRFRIPVGKKSDKIIFPEWLKREEIIEFISGFFDGDGSLIRRKIENKIYFEIKIRSKSKEFLLDLLNFLERLGIRAKFSEERIPAIRIYSKKDILTFFKIFKPKIKGPPTPRGEIL